jgi:hypothetical protein
MRPWSLILLLFGCASCIVRVQPPPGVAVSLTAAVRANANVNVRVEPPPPPAPAVELQGAPVVEFFGVPLEGAPDVVFVLDCSGSMTEPAQGRLAQLGAQGSPAAAPSPPEGSPPAGSPPAAPSPPDGSPPDGSPPDGSPPDGSPPDGSPPDGSPPEGSPPAAPSPPAVPTKIDVARNELIDALQRLPAGTAMNVIFFNRSVEAFAPGMVPLEETGRDGLIAFVREMTATGSTALVPAMRVAFLMNARRIVLLSDGLGNVGGDSSALLRDAREAMRGGVRIDAIGLGQEQDAALLQALASESGGIYQPL